MISFKAQREILDAELELYNKEQEGEDTATLVNKVLNLRANHMETTYRGPMSFRGTFRGFRCRGRGSIRGSHQLRALRTVDRRPTKIQVTGFPAVRLPEILPHFSVCLFVIFLFYFIFCLFLFLNNLQFL